MSDLVLVEERGDVALVALNRPDKRNAISRALSFRLREALAELQRAKVVILTGEGPAFCAGVDLTERRDPNWADALGVDDAQHWLETLQAVHRHPAVVVAAVNGPAIGGGMTLVNASDLAVASERATFGAPELSFGSFPALSGSSAVKRLLPKHAAQLVFTARPVSAATAERWGLVNEVVEHDALRERAWELAESIAAWEAPALAFAKRALDELAALDWSRALEQGVLVSALTRRLA
ncbi:enoyl-CoA hydratase/isomerase family protein [Microbacterium ulmi]|uniref:Enoyl-CoA hydratase/isomerase family protein n=1 Tax=Microbacterium ulmi TaxID=179095 RepID=A0A7Y2LZV2_9MICO|nr:enoyl-CoA hydratase/isomerase family protein [Microbacterium ulmi]NII69859.1 enoyl-CoA hydratase/carnithine racemase [Microbacterium ulmi]NNH03174.1 enoyl-CoA hydratase/isomerase family protein [Microbacterium ulmi]